MKPAHYIKKVKTSEEFKRLVSEDSGAYLCSLFFLRDFTDNKEETQVDFYSPKRKKIVSFEIGKNIAESKNKKAETLSHKKFIPKQLSEKLKMDVDEVKPILEDEMHNREMVYEIEKVLAFLNTVEGKPVWNCTGFLKGLGLLQANIDDETASVLFMDKKSFFDLLRFTGKKPGQENQSQGKPRIKILNSGLKKEDKNKKGN